MRGVSFKGDRTVSFIDVPDPAPEVGEVVLEVAASGMCGSDLHQFRRPSNASDGETPWIAGHEPAGTVVAIGAGVTSAIASVGDRIMVHHYVGCGACPSCKSGWTQLCSGEGRRAHGKNEHGSHAPFMRVPSAAVVPLDDALSFDAGAAISCGTGTAWGGLRRLGDIGGSTIAVFGLGPVGQSAVMLASAMGARVIGIDPVDFRRDQALTNGAVDIVDPSAMEVSIAVRELMGGSGMDAVLETSGSNQAAEAALSTLTTWGRACFVGLGSRVNFDVRDYLRSQITIMTSYSMSVVGQMECANFVAEHQLPIDALFSHRWSLQEAQEAYEWFDRQDAGKGMFTFERGSIPSERSGNG